jgi:hypothetical protein
MNTVAALIAKLDAEDQQALAEAQVLETRQYNGETYETIGEWDEGYHAGLRRALDIVRHHKWPSTAFGDARHRKVVVEVSGVVAHVTEAPDDVEVEVIDHDDQEAERDAAP